MIKHYHVLFKIRVFLGELVYFKKEEKREMSKSQIEKIVR